MGSIYVVARGKTPKGTEFLRLCDTNTNKTQDTTLAILKDAIMAGKIQLGGAELTAGGSLRLDYIDIQNLPQVGKWDKPLYVGLEYRGTVTYAVIIQPETCHVTPIIIDKAHGVDLLNKQELYRDAEALMLKSIKQTQSNSHSGPKHAPYMPRLNRSEKEADIETLPVRLAHVRQVGFAGAKKEIDSQVIPFIVDTIREQLEPFGFQVDFGGGSIEPNRLTIKLRMAIQSEEIERAAFAEHCRYFGLQPQHYSRIVPVNGRDARLVGFQPSRRKYPIMAQYLDNGEIVLLTAQIKSTLEREDRRAGV